jgi:hypothetical protein
MAGAIARRAARGGASLAVATFLVGACAALQPPPGPQSIEGMSPVGTVQLTETFVTGVGGGSGTLRFQGHTYPFQVVAGVAGPGGGAEKIAASGEVFNLNNVADFGGAYSQSSGKGGLATSGASDLWLRNKSGVVMHLQGTSSGALLTLLGREEVFIRMSQ